MALNESLLGTQHKWNELVLQFIIYGINKARIMDSPHILWNAYRICMNAWYCKAIWIKIIASTKWHIFYINITLILGKPSPDWHPVHRRCICTTRLLQDSYTGLGTVNIIRITYRIHWLHVTRLSHFYWYSKVDEKQGWTVHKQFPWLYGNIWECLNVPDWNYERCIACKGVTEEQINMPPLLTP